MTDIDKTHIHISKSLQFEGSYVEDLLYSLKLLWTFGKTESESLKNKAQAPSS